jgi:hypothetical protein
MKHRDQDRLLICAIAVLCLAALIYGGVAIVAWLVGRGVTIKEVDAAAWTQAVGSVAAIAALVWQRSHEVATGRESARQAAAEQQNGARRLVQVAANLCAEFADERWPLSGKLSAADRGFYSARIQAAVGALRRVDAHALPSWRHTESVLVAISAMDALNFELRRSSEITEPTRGRVARRADAAAPAWVSSFKAMAKQFQQQLVVRAWVMEQGLDQSLDPA